MNIEDSRPTAKMINSSFKMGFFRRNFSNQHQDKNSIKTDIISVVTNRYVIQRQVLSVIASGRSSFFTLNIRRFT